MVRGGGQVEADSIGGSRWGIVDAVVSHGAGLSAAAQGEQMSFDAGRAAVSDFNESEADTADAFEQGVVGEDRRHAMDSMIADQAESADAASVHSTGKIDPQAPGWTRRLPIFTDEASSAAILMEMVRDGAQPEGCSGGGSRCGVDNAGPSGEVGVQWQPSGRPN